MEPAYCEDAFLQKSMLHSASIADHARHASDFGVELGAVKIDLENVQKRKDKVVRQNAGGVAFLLKKNKVDTMKPGSCWGISALPSKRVAR